MKDITTPHISDFDTLRFLRRPDIACADHGARQADGDRRTSDVERRVIRASGNDILRIAPWNCIGDEIARQK
ncbi:MAG: hypothetical protein ACRD9W_25340, partial [Terriglobia bacterium]